MNDFRIATWQGLGRGKDGRKLKYLSKKAQDGVWNIKQAAKALKTRWARLRQNDDALARIELAFAAAPVLKTAYWLLEDARRILDARRLDAAAGRYAAWPEKKPPRGRTEE